MCHKVSEGGANCLFHLSRVQPVTCGCTCHPHTHIKNSQAEFEKSVIGKTLFWLE